MTKRGNPKFFQVLVCQMRQDTKIDVILGKALRVLPKTELLKPVSDLLHRGSAPCQASPARIGKFTLKDAALESKSEPARSCEKC